jgi:hypothetical protein
LGGLGVKLVYPPGATPLGPNEIEGLIPNIGLQSELNAREEENINILIISSVLL